MTNDTIIAEWRFGKRKETIAKEYAENTNKIRKMHGDKTKMTPKQALAIVEPVIFNYQVKIMKGEWNGNNNRRVIKTNA